MAKILDYVRCRLEGLGYKNFAVFGTSALQNFYLDNVPQLIRYVNCLGEQARRKNF